MPTSSPPRPARSDTAIRGPVQIEIRPVGLERLRAHLIRAREERGPCPPLIELQLDLLPGEEELPGKQERTDHLARCMLCIEDLQVWKASWQGRAAFALRHARIHGGAVARAIRALWHRDPKPPRAHVEPKSRSGGRAKLALVEQEPKPSPRRNDVHPPVVALSPPPEPATQAPARGASAAKERRQRSQPDEDLGLILFEAALPGNAPLALVRAAAERGGGVVPVQSLEETYRDPDFRLVRTIVLTRSRAVGDWPAAIQEVQDRAPGVAVLAVVPAPRFARLNWMRDPGVLTPPVDDGEWARALEHAGWQVAR